MPLTSAFSKENSVISLEEWVLVFKVFTTATRKLRVNRDCFASLRLSLRFLQEKCFFLSFFRFPKRWLSA